MKTDSELIELLAIQVKSLKRITCKTDKLDCLAQMIGTCAKLSKHIIIRMVQDADSA